LQQQSFKSVKKKVKKKKRKNCSELATILNYGDLAELAQEATVLHSCAGVAFFFFFFS
jgi:hypothetical protein